ncbi:thioredoxin domain-containing protein [Pseudomonas fluorescens]|uniref:Thioredoxin domain-containing protein n=1 Tax=Pseudomonas fluorescens TaxID=294 RepID=A0A379IG13_PSEFL|nr:DsbA family protein [Pseudomonas fluorescens]AIG01956.1 hypothetical protein HZ99_07170 [Pseudomonas fluorescens]SUD31755.1 thioredoxin domain-containing protein [Pseudomonas fluorescens]
MIKCDTESRICSVDGEASALGLASGRQQTGFVVHYVGDPMCSWCWGISPAIAGLAAYCSAQGIDFVLTVGGLRAGGGDPWTEPFKAFLRKEWAHIQQVTGQPFGGDLLARDTFNYDTEPSCRAVVTAAMMIKLQELETFTALDFFRAVQYKFYVEGQDPTQPTFYQSVCGDLGLSFSEFALLFDSPMMKRRVEQEFKSCRSWGVNAFPSILVERKGSRALLAVGEVSQAQLIARLEETMRRAK